MTESYDTIPSSRNVGEAQTEWESAINFNPRSNTYKLVRALVSELDRTDSNLEEIYEQHHVDSATGDDLEKFGRLVDVDRNTGESDDRYRARIKASFRASTIGTTFDQFVEFCVSVLNTNSSNLDFETPYVAEPATVRITADASVYTDAGFTASDIADLLGDGVPAGHEVQIVERGTFELKADGDTDDADKGLTADGTQNGGTLAADLV